MLVFIIFVLFLLIGGYFAFRYVEQVHPPRKIAGKPSYHFEMNEELHPDVKHTGEYKRDKISEEKKTTNSYAIWEEDPPIYLNIKKPHIHFLMKDPDWLFCYWYWGQDSLDDFNQQYGDNAWNNSTPVIRYHEPTTGFLHDFLINDYAHTWYFKVNRRNVPITMYLGRIYQGEFIHLATANTYKVPLGMVSPNVDPLWRPVPGLMPTDLENEYIGGISSPELIPTN